MKNKLTDDELENKLKTLFGVSEGHIFNQFAKDICSTFVNSLSMAEHYTNKEIKEFMYDYSFGDGDEELKWLLKYGNLAYGYFTDECSEPEETWLCYNDLNYEDDDIIISHRGGY